MATREESMARLEWRADCLKARADALERRADAEDPCWNGYEQRGTKEQDERTVSNCVETDARADDSSRWEVGNNHGWFVLRPNYGKDGGKITSTCAERYAVGAGGQVRKFQSQAAAQKLANDLNAKR